MKEPELEENKLTGDVRGDQLVIDRRGLEGGDRRVTVTKPDGTGLTVTLKDQNNGHAQAGVTVDQNGLWRLSDETLNTLVAVGSLDPVELSDVRATKSRLQALVSANGGGLFWLEDGLPALLRQDKNSQMAGSGWLGLRDNGEETLINATSQKLLPGWLLLLSLALSLFYAWWRESRR
jgi:hypothetical protein